jgi:hypothetical protein
LKNNQSDKKMNSRVATPNFSSSALLIKCMPSNNDIGNHQWFPILHYYSLSYVQIENKQTTIMTLEAG